MEQVGQLQPIHVRRDGKQHYYLITGRGRLEARRTMGKGTKVRCIVLDINEGDRHETKLVRIDENLVRVPLTQAEIDDFVAERKALIERLDPETAPEARKSSGGKAAGRGRRKSAGQNANAKKSSTEQVAEQTGMSKRATQESARRGEKAADSVKEAHHQQEITTNHVNALCSLSKEDQEQALPQVKGKSVDDTKQVVAERKKASAPSSSELNRWATKIASTADSLRQQVAQKLDEVEASDEVVLKEKCRDEVSTSIALLKGELRRFEDFLHEQRKRETIAEGFERGSRALERHGQ